MGTPWRFYVYVCGDLDAPVYIGKGSGRRASVSAQARGAPATELARFKRECDAYQFEREAIAELAPSLNRHRGGNGSKATPIKGPRPDAWTLEARRCGTRLMAAAILAQKGIMLTPWGRLDWRDGILTPHQVVEA